MKLFSLPIYHFYIVIFTNCNDDKILDTTDYCIIKQINLWIGHSEIGLTKMDIIFEY